MNTGEVVQIPLARIGGDQKVRNQRLDLDHVATMTAFLDQLPPIVVRQHPNRPENFELIDGSHRVAAFNNQKRDVIPAVVVAADDVEALAMAAQANVAHGRTLSMLDRRRAAEKLLQMAPDRSDRWIAEHCGLSDKTVGAMRPTAEFPQLDTPDTTGKDGRTRPTPEKAKANREKAREILKGEPDISTRDLAEKAGVSRGTAANVKNEPPKLQVAPEPEGVTIHDLGVVVPANWLKHPAAKSSNDGRDFCGWLDRRSIRGDDLDQTVRKYAEMCPSEIVTEVAAHAEAQATAWRRLAELVRSRPTKLGVVK